MRDQTKLLLVLGVLTLGVAACGPEKTESCPKDGGPFVRGTNAEYSKYSDRDGDGIACE